MKWLRNMIIEYHKFIPYYPNTKFMNKKLVSIDIGITIELSHLINSKLINIHIKSYTRLFNSYVNNIINKRLKN